MRHTEKVPHLRLGSFVQSPLWLTLCFLFSFGAAAGESNPDNSIAGGVEIHGVQYLDSGRSYFRHDAANNNLSVMPSSRADFKFNHGLGIAWDVDTEYSAVEKWNYFRPHELYATYSGENSTVWIGRKKFNYSQWEERWNQGLFQPRFMDDKLHSSTAGLVGLFGERNFSSLHLRAGFMPISIPEFGPNYSVQNGQLVSKSPWFQAPPSNFVYGGQSTSIQYSVDQPDAWKAVAKAGAMAQAEYNFSENFYSRTSYAYKPMPQVVLGFPIVLNLPGTAFVKIEPRFLYHQVINEDLVLKSGAAEYGVSVAMEHPIKDNLPDTWEQQSVSDATIASAYATSTVDEAKSWRVTGSLIKVWGGDRPDSGPVETTLSLFERRFQYTEAGSLEVRKNWSQALSSGFKITYDRLQNGLIYSGDALQRLTNEFSLRLSFDIFDLVSGKASVPDGFIDTYRGNDRISLGVNYAF